MVSNPEFLKKMAEIYGKESEEEEPTTSKTLDTHMTQDEFEALLDERYSRGKRKRNTRFGQE